MANEQNLQGLLNGYSSFENLVVHEELGQIVELARLKTGLVVATPLVHNLELILVYEAVEVVVDFPDVEGDLRAQQLEAKEGQHLHQVCRSDLLLLGWLL